MPKAGRRGPGSGRKVIHGKRKRLTSPVPVTPTLKKLEKPVYQFEENGFYIKKPWNSSKLHHNGEIYNLGDIIRVTGSDERTYYGEILKFWSDSYTEKFVTLQWLIPIQNISKDGPKFYPDKYTHGPVHTDLVNVRSIGFVMTAFKFGAPPNSPAFNRTGELAVMFNSNIPSKTSVSVPDFNLMTK